MLLLCLHNRKCALNRLCWPQGSMGQRLSCWLGIILLHRLCSILRNRREKLFLHRRHHWIAISLHFRVGERSLNLLSRPMMLKLFRVFAHVSTNIDASPIVLTFNYRGTSILTSQPSWLDRVRLFIDEFMQLSCDCRHSRLSLCTKSIINQIWLMKMNFRFFTFAKQRDFVSCETWWGVRRVGHTGQETKLY